MWEGSGGLVVMRVLVCLCLSSLSRSCLVYVCCAFSGCREGSCAHVFPHFHPPLSPPLSLFSLSSSPTSYSSSTSLHPFVTSILHCQIFVCLRPLSQASSVACSGSTDGSRAGSVVFFWYLIPGRAYFVTLTVQGLLDPISRGITSVWLYYVGLASRGRRHTACV